MRLRVLIVLAVIALGLAAGPDAQAADPCNARQARIAVEDHLFPWAEAHDPRGFYSGYGGITELDYGLGRLRCPDLTGDGKQEMVAQMLCCTGGSPTPWGIFKHDSRGTWRLAYARALDNVWLLRVRGRTVRARQPASYNGGCTKFFRDRVVRWNGSRFTSRLSAQYFRRPPRGCPGASLIIGDMFHLRLRHPATLSLWASDALVHLRWRHWDDSVATATGKITTLPGGRYRYLPAKVVASAPARCSGRFFGYTKLRYHAFGRWWTADRDGCRFFGGGL